MEENRNEFPKDNTVSKIKNKFNNLQFGKNEKNLNFFNQHSKENSNKEKKPVQYSDKLFLSIKKNFKEIENIADSKDKLIISNNEEKNYVMKDNNDIDVENKKNMNEFSNFCSNDSKQNLINLIPTSTKSDLISLLNITNEKKSDSKIENKKLSVSSNPYEVDNLNRKTNIIQISQKSENSLISKISYQTKEKNIPLTFIDSEPNLSQEEKESSKFSFSKINQNDVKQIKISSKMKDLRDISFNDMTNYKSKCKSNSSLILNDISDSKSMENKPLLTPPIASSKFLKKETLSPNRNLFKIEKLSESDSEDEKDLKEFHHKFLIMPYNGYKKFFDFIMSLIILYSSIIIPYKISFIDCDGQYDTIIECFIKICLILDIFLNCITAYTDKENKLITNRKKIIINYFKTWFIIDLISILPLWIPSNDSGCNNDTYRHNNDHYPYYYFTRSSNFLNTYFYFRSMRLFRLLKMLNKKRNVSSLAKYIGEKLKITRNIEKLFYFSLLFLLFNHLSACIWYYLARIQEKSPESWVNRLNYLNADNFELYMISLYWTLTIVTTVGYGDVNAGTEIERIFSLFIMCFGVLMYSFAIGSMSVILESINSKGLELNQKLQILASIKKEFSLKSDIYHKVCKVIKHDQNRNLHEKINFLQSLPNKLKIELSKILYDDVIYKLYFFREQPAEFFSYVVPLLKPIKFSKRDYLYKINDTIDEIYLIAKGTISFCLDEVYLETEIKEVKKYNNFGEIEMCLNEKLDYNIKVKSRNCELFVLKKNNFLSLSVNYKEFFDNFMRHSLVLYSRFNFKKRKIMKALEEDNTQVQENMKKKNKQIEEEHENFHYVSSEEREEVSSEENEEILEFENSDKNSEISEEEKKVKEESYISSSDSSNSNSRSKSHSKTSMEKSKNSVISENSENSSNNSNNNKSHLNKNNLNMPEFSNEYKVMDILQTEREITKKNSPEKNKFRKANSELINEKQQKLPTNLEGKINSNTSTYSLNTISKQKLISNNNLNRSLINNSAQNFSNTTNNIYKYINNNNTFTSNFKIGSNANFSRKSLAESGLNLLKRFQVVKNEEDTEDQSTIPMIRNQIRKHTSMSYNNDSDENDSKNFTLENENMKFYNLVDRIIELLENNKKTFLEKYQNKIDHPISLLNRLKTAQNLSERNEIIEMIESIANNSVQS